MKGMPCLSEYNMEKEYAHARNLHDLIWKTTKKHFKRRTKMKKGLFLVVIFVLLLSAACTAKVEAGACSEL